MCLVGELALVLEADDGPVDVPAGPGGVRAGLGEAPGLAGFAALLCPLGADDEVNREEGGQEGGGLHLKGILEWKCFVG